eukprot:gene10179-2338_t
MAVSVEATSTLINLSFQYSVSFNKQHSVYVLSNFSTSATLTKTIERSAVPNETMAVFGIPFSLIFMSIIGLYKVFSVLFTIIRSIHATYYRPEKDLTKFGKWAVVTGATDGIGLEYCKQFARKGISVVMISRNQEKLEEVRSLINNASPNVELRIVDVDMSNNAKSVYPIIEAALRDLDIGILVNNVGISYDFPEFFSALDQDRIDKLIRLNILSVNEMTRIVLPGMEERKRGAIINVSSGSGTLPTPLLTVYSATKAYVDFFSQGLAVEVKSKGIFVQSLVPLFVVSKLSKIRKPSLFTPTPEKFVRSAIRTIGYDHCTSGFLFHDIQLAIGKMLPKWFVDKQLFNMHLSLQKRALRKQEKSK